MKLIIVRHGETEWNKEGKLQGIVDIPISKVGIHQAMMIADRLKGAKIDAIYTSKLKRAIKTARIISNHHSHIKIIQAKELNEMSWGKWEGMTMASVKKNYAKLYEKREKDKFRFKTPKGESPYLHQRRISRFIKKLSKKEKNKSVLIVGHGGTNRAIISSLLNWSIKKTMKIRMHNASLTVINIKNGKARMSLFDSKHHLTNGKMPS